MRVRVQPSLQAALLTEFMDGQFLSDLDAELQGLLGETYEVIQRRDARERRTKGIESRHRLAVLLDIVQKHRSGIRGLPLSLLATIGELNTTRHLLANSRHDPLWNKLVRGISSPDEYPHTLILLGVAALFRRQEIDVELMQDPGGRICDFRLISPDREHVNVEVKTPRELLWPPETLTPRAARLQIARLFKKAGTTSRGHAANYRPMLRACS